MNLMIDHYDSFTFNLVQLISGQDREILVRRKDEITLEEIQARRWEAIFLSPGPCSPRETGHTPEVIRKCHAAGKRFSSPPAPAPPGRPAIPRR
jgi:anthranilate/para-aminobenzoate synthase component II